MAESQQVYSGSFQQQKGKFQQFMQSLGSQTPISSAKKAGERSTSKLVTSQVEKATILQTLAKANQIMRNQSSDLNSVQRHTPLPAFNNGRLITNLPSQRSNVDGDTMNNTSMQLEPKFRGPITEVIISNNQSKQTLKHAKSTEHIIPTADNSLQQSEHTRLTSVIDANQDQLPVQQVRQLGGAKSHFGSMPTLKPNFGQVSNQKLKINVMKKNYDQFRSQNQIIINQEYNSLDLAQFLQKSDRKPSNKMSARYHALKASEKQALKMQNQIRKSIMNVQRYDAMQQRKLAPYSHAVSMREEYANTMAASMEMSTDLTPVEYDKPFHQPGHLSQMSLHLKQVKDYNSFGNQDYNKKHASITNATSLLVSRKDHNRMRGPISDSMETENLFANQRSVKPQLVRKLLDMSASVDRTESKREIDSILTGARSNSHLGRQGNQSSLKHKIEGLVVPMHGASSMLQDSAPDSTLTLINSSSRSAAKANKKQALESNFSEANVYQLHQVIAGGAKSVTSMPKVEQDELVAEKLKFKLKQRDQEQDKLNKALQIQNTKMIGRMGGGTTKFNQEALPKAMQASTILKEGSIDSSLDKRKMYEKKRTFREFERTENQAKLSQGPSPKHQSIEHVPRGSISSLMKENASNYEKSRHISHLDSMEAGQILLHDTSMMIQSTNETAPFLRTTVIQDNQDLIQAEQLASIEQQVEMSSPTRRADGSVGGISQIYKLAYNMGMSEQDLETTRLKHQQRRQEDGIVHPRKSLREHAETNGDDQSPARDRDNTSSQAYNQKYDFQLRKASMADSKVSELKSWAKDSVHGALVAPPADKDDQIIGSPIVDVKKLVKRAGFDEDFKAKLQQVENTTNELKDRKLIKRLEAGDYGALAEIVPQGNLEYHDSISFFSADNRIAFRTQEHTGKPRRELNKISISKRREQTQKQLSAVRQKQIDEINQMRAVFTQKQDEARAKVKDQLVKMSDPVQIVKNSPERQNKQMIRSMKKLRDKYTIMAKEWVLNPPPTLPSTTSFDLTQLDNNTTIREASSPQVRRSSNASTHKLGHSFSKGLQRGTLRKGRDFNKIKREDKKLQSQSVTQSYLRRKEHEIEIKRDKQYKKMLNIFKKEHHCDLDESSYDTEGEGDSSDYESSQDNVSVSIAEQQSILNGKSSSQATTLKVGAGTGVEFENYNGQFEALEYNGISLPDEFLLAKLAFHEDPIEYWVNYKASRESREGDRRNTDYHFNQADMYCSSQGSFNQMFESEMPYQEVNKGLHIVMQELKEKSEFYKEVKYTNKNINHKLDSTREVYRNFAEKTIGRQNVPIPILLKIKHGILSLPASYTVTEGVAFAMRSSLEAMQGIEERQIQKVILHKNSISDTSFATILKGLKKRAEFFCLITRGNDIGVQTAKELSHLIAQDPLDPKDLKALLTAQNAADNADIEATMNDNTMDPMEPSGDKMSESSEGAPEDKAEECSTETQVEELRIRSCKCDPKAIDIIITQLYAPVCYLRRLALSDLWMSERQQKTLLGSLKDTQLVELDLSWLKMQAPALGLLFTALEENRTLQNLNLGWIQMGGSKGYNEVLEKNFGKFCSFLKESMKLVHLNLTSVNLPEKFFVELICNIKRSRSLHCVHLCGNKFTPASIETLNLKLKPTMINSMDKKEGKQRKTKKLLNKLQEVIESRYRERYDQIYDAVQTKENMLEWLSVRQPYTNSAAEDTDFVPLILSKQLGHGEIRNAKHWKINNECYQCDRWKQTLIFWDLKNKGKPFQISDPLLEEMIDDMIASSNERFNQLRGENKLTNGARAFISGTFTDWQPRRMMLIDEFLARLQKKDDILESNDRRVAFAESIESSWRNSLQQHLQYKGDNTQMVDYPESYQFTYNNPPKLDRNQLFVYSDFIKPGKHQYIVSYENEIKQPPPYFPPEQPTHNRWASIGSSVSSNAAGNKSHRSSGRKLTKEQQKILDDFVPMVSKVKLTSYHEFVGSALLTHYHINTKENKFDAVERNFDLSKSVFKEWKLDRPKMIEQGLVEEVLYWNVANFVKDEEEVAQIVEVMKKHAVFLKTMFIIRSAASAYPSIRWLSYAPMIADLDIFDATFDMGAVDRIFIAVTTRLPESLKGKLPEKDMSRFQFYESIVRVAMAKYKGQTTETVLEGLKKLFDEVLLPQVDSYMWQGFREQHIWTLEMDDLYKSNMTAMQKLYKYYFAQKKRKQYLLEDACDMFGSAVQLDLLPEQITTAFGMAKMTVNNDIKQRNQYYVLNFAEFLEFFSRVANQKYKDGPRAMDPLVEKVERLMDLVFPIIGMKRKEVNIEEEYVSVSEEELDEDRYFI